MLQRTKVLRRAEKDKEEMSHHLLVERDAWNEAHIVVQQQQQQQKQQRNKNRRGNKSRHIIFFASFHFREIEDRQKCVLRCSKSKIRKRPTDKTGMRKHTYKVSFDIF